MKYPDYLSIGNWLFQHLKKDEFETRPVGGPIPENLYISLSRWRAMDLSKDLRTYEGLMEAGATEPDDKGNNIPAHIARVGGDGLNEGTDETPLRKEVMKLATVENIINYLAGKTIECVGVMGPYKTSRLKAKTNAAGQRDGYEVVGLRNTSIPVFEVK